jgi:hypothetical protein
MANKGGQLTPQWLGSITAKVLGVTALVAAAVGLVNGAIDLYKAISKVPTNTRRTETTCASSQGRNIYPLPCCA